MTISYAKDDAEMRDRWRKRIKFDLLELATDKPPLEGKEAHDKVAEALSPPGQPDAQTSNDELLEMYLTGLTTAYDPHTSYMSAHTRWRTSRSRCGSISKGSARRWKLRKAKRS